MKISEFSPTELPVERILDGQVGSLTLTELIATLLGSGIPGKNVIELARECLTHFGGLSGLSNASVQELISIPGIKKTKAARVKAALQLIHHFNQSNISPKLDTEEKMVHFIRPKLHFARQEQLHLLLLDHSLCLDEWHLFSRGTHNEIQVFIKELLRFVLKVGSPNVVLIHNHLEDIPVPSIEDDHVTQVVKDRLAIFDVQLLSHLIVGKVGHASLSL